MTKIDRLRVAAAQMSGGCEIRTREGLPPTRFPSVRPRPLGESSGGESTGRGSRGRTPYTGGRPLVRRSPREIPQGRKAARVSGFWRVRGGSLRGRGQAGKGPTPEPCGVCDSCVALAPDGPGSLDVIEIDAASHGGVDDARDLRERAFFAPVSSRYKVYIVDEAHMVSTQGFNALLKLVEEPPEHLRFIFATTEPEKVIPTIRSRTHHYPFRLIPPRLMSAYLTELCEKEQVPVEPAALHRGPAAAAAGPRDRRRGPGRHRQRPHRRLGGPGRTARGPGGPLRRDRPEPGRRHPGHRPHPDARCHRPATAARAPLRA